LALLPFGFADGLPRAAQGSASVLLHTRDGAFRRPIVGRIAMDQCVIDAGDLPVRAGDLVTVFGPGDDGEPTVADWAHWSATNPHEILTGIGPRVERRPFGRTFGNSALVGRATGARSPKVPNRALPTREEAS
jgi:alanine racemase